MSMPSGREPAACARCDASGLPDAVSSMRPAEYGDEHSGIRRLCVSLGSCLGSSPAVSASARCPRSFSHQRGTRLIHRCPMCASLSASSSETDTYGSHLLRHRPRQRVCAALRGDDTAIVSLAEAHSSSSEGAHTWRAAQSAALDRPGRVVARRLLHGKLFKGAFIHRGTPESHLCVMPSVPGNMAVVCPGFNPRWVQPVQNCPLGREGPFRLSCWTVYVACHGEAASPGVGRAVYPTFLEVSCRCCCDWQDRWTCKASPPRKEKKKQYKVIVQKIQKSWCLI